MSGSSFVVPSAMFSGVSLCLAPWLLGGRVLCRPGRCFRLLDLAVGWVVLVRSGRVGRWVLIALRLLVRWRRVVRCAGDCPLGLASWPLGLRRLLCAVPVGSFRFRRPVSWRVLFGVLPGRVGRLPRLCLSASGCSNGRCRFFSRFVVRVVGLWCASSLRLLFRLGAGSPGSLFVVRWASGSGRVCRCLSWSLGLLAFSFCRRVLFGPPFPLPLPLSCRSFLLSSSWVRVRLSSRLCLLLGPAAIRMASVLILSPCVARSLSPSGSVSGMVRVSGLLAAMCRMYGDNYACICRLVDDSCPIIITYISAKIDSRNLICTRFTRSKNSLTFNP